MPYPEMMVRPMREDLTRIGVTELTTAQEVDTFLEDKTGSAMIVVNSVCGCAAGNARPAVALSLESPNKPTRVATVFAGQDTDATARAREHFPQLPPSSPSIIIINQGEVFEYIPRHAIEGHQAQAIADELTNIFDRIAAA